jgi:putative ABC transport system ATP-binding protein
MNRPIVLETENLSKAFGEKDRPLQVLDQVSLSIRAGDSWAIVGPSGSGKSTLLGLLAGLDTPSEGRVLLGGTDLGSLKEHELARIHNRKVGFVFQSYRLLPTLSAEENVRVPLDLAGDPESKDKARVWIEKVGLTHRKGHLPAQLSGGEQQRIALARALAHEPEVVFADEPTGNLDSRTGAAVADLLFSLVRERGTTLILATHELSLAQRTDRILELKDGKIIREGPSSQW